MLQDFMEPFPVSQFKMPRRKERDTSRFRVPIVASPLYQQSEISSVSQFKMPRRKERDTSQFRVPIVASPLYQQSEIPPISQFKMPRRKERDTSEPVASLPESQQRFHAHLHFEEHSSSEPASRVDSVTTASLNVSWFQRLLSLIPRRILGFSVVGGGVMIGGMVLLFVLVHFLHVEKHLAYLIQAVSSIEANFFLNRFLNWKRRDGNLAMQWLKFHSTSAITFPLNQALFALLTWIGISYLVVTVIGAGVAAIVNYFANDRFVFHRQEITKQETIHIQSVQPLVQIAHVGVIIPVRNSQRTIRACLTSVLEQNYPGQISIFLVGNVPEQDATWSVLEDLLQDPRVHRIQIRRPAEWIGRDANMKRYCGCQAAIAAGADAIALLDSQVIAPKNWLSHSVHLLQHYHIDGVAGRSYGRLQDTTFPSLYQDHSLFSEWPSYGEGFFLSKAAFRKARGLPVTNNLLIKKQAWEQVHRRWPLKAAYSWEDFRLAWEMASVGCVVYCTDAIYVYRNHKPKFRLAKHFAAGAGAMLFYQEQSSCLYARWALFKAAFVAVDAVVLVILLTTAAVLRDGLLLTWLSGSIGFALFALGIVSSLKARDIRGMLFPLLDMVHIGLWIVGAAYVAMKREETATPLAEALVAWR